MAKFAFGAIFAPMQIGMAVLALVWSIGEFEIGMAVAARHGCVASTKSKARLPMIKFDLALDYLPIGFGVACNARHVELAVRTLRACEGPRRLGVQGARPQEKHYRNED
jgi:hypothetical protein